MKGEGKNIIEKDVNWDSPILKRWLDSIVRAGTRYVYRSAFRMYAQYTGLSPEQLVEEALEDARRDPRERTDVVKRRLIGFYNWLVTEAPKKKPGGGGEIQGRGVSSKLAHTYVNAIRSFYDTYGVVVKLKGRSALPRPRVTNKRMRLSNMDVKRLLDHCRSPRDRAIILVMFQSGMDVSTLCSLKYGDVAEGLAKDEHPLRLNLYRPKTGTEYYTFLGKDACEALRAYLNDLKAKGIQLSYNDPLFLKEGRKALRKEPIRPNLVQKLMRELAVKAGFVDENMNGRAINPVSPHALRESFSSILVSNKVPTTIVDFFLGHELGELARAYQRVEVERLRQIYLEVEKHLSIVQPPTVIKEIEERLRNQIERQNMIIQSLEARLKRMEAFLFKVLPGATDEDLDLLRQRYEQRVMNEIQDYKKQQANPSVD